MRDLKTSKRYARAIMYLFNEGKDSEILENNFNTFIEIINKDKVIYFLLNNPVLLNNEKILFLENICSKFFFDFNFINFLKILIIKKRINLLYDIHSQTISIIDEKVGRIRINLFSSFSLDSDLLGKINSIFKKIFNKNIIFNLIIDYDIIGGIKASSGGLIFDSTIKNKLVFLRDIIKK